jgi:hypothetical protein
MIACSMSLCVGSIARYDDGYINAPGKMAQEVGYPEDWYDKSERSDNLPKTKKQTHGVNLKRYLWTHFIML